MTSARPVTGWSQVTTTDLETFLGHSPSSSRHQRTYVLRGFFSWAKRRKLILIDPAISLRMGSQPAFTGNVLDATVQRALFRRWTGHATIRTKRLTGLLALLHAASNAQIRGLTIGDADAARRTLNLAGRPFPVPLDPVSWPALEDCLRHGTDLRTLNPHVIVTRATRTGDSPAHPTYLTRVLRPAGTTPSLCRQTRIAQLVTDLDPSSPPPPSHARLRARPLPRRQRGPRPSRTHPAHQPANPCAAGAALHTLTRPVRVRQGRRRSTFKSGYGFTRWGPGWPIPPRAWRCCCGRCTPLEHLRRPPHGADGGDPADPRPRGPTCWSASTGAGARPRTDQPPAVPATPRRRVLFTCGWAITEADEQAIRLLPATGWQARGGPGRAPSSRTSTSPRSPTLMRRAGRWPAGLRGVVRRTRPSRRQARNLTAFETRHRLAGTPSSAPTSRPRAGSPGVPGSHHAQFIGRAAPPARRRRRRRPHREIDGPAESSVEDMDGELRVGTCRQPRRRPVPPGFRLLGLYDCDDLADAEPDTLRYRLLSLPARLVPPRPAARAEDQPHLALEGGIPDLLAAAIHPARPRLTSRSRPRIPERRPPRRSRSRWPPEHIGSAAICCGHMSQIQPPKTGTTRSVTNLAPPLNR